MNIEEFENKGFPIRKYLGKIVIIVIFAFLLVWLYQKTITPMFEQKDKKSSLPESSQKSDITQSTTASSQTFQDNLKKMKDAALSYYTIELLPKNVGDSETMTLNDMISKKIIASLTDKNNKKVDGKASYVKITKTVDEYILKVNIKDSEKEECFTIHLNNYSYCKNYLCEKQNELESESSLVESVNNETTNTVIKKTITKSSTSSSKKNTDSVNTSEKKSDKSSKTTIKYIIKTASKETTSTTSKITTCIENETCLIKCYYDKKHNVYFGANGKEVTKEEYENECSSANTQSKNYLYQYQKNAEPQFTKWSSWTTWTKTKCTTQSITCDDSSETCLKNIERYDQQEKVGTQNKKYSITRSALKQTGSQTIKTCSNYNYVIVNNKIYITSATTNYNIINTITGKTAKSTGIWIYASHESLSTAPKDTPTTYYKFAGADFSNCNDTCTTLPNYYYDKYIYGGDALTTVSSVTSTPTNANCSSYAYKTVPIYSYVNETETVTREEPIYKTICYERTRTRNIVKAGSILYKWSSYNDTSLINNGWTYTGSKKEA